MCCMYVGTITKTDARVLTITKQFQKLSAAVLTLMVVLLYWNIIEDVVEARALCIDLVIGVTYIEVSNTSLQ